VSARRRARELVLKALYAFQTSDQNPEEVWETLHVDSGLEKKPLKFANELFHLVLNNIDRLDQEIVKHSENWHISRLALIDKNIMRIAICELFFMPDVPSRVSLNEAIEMAKTYSTPDSSSFVNGILNAILKDHQPEIEG
jgi:N utilization substance protein B